MSENVSIASTKLLPPTTRRLPSKMPLTYIFTVFFSTLITVIFVNELFSFGDKS